VAENTHIEPGEFNASVVW